MRRSIHSIVLLIPVFLIGCATGPKPDLISAAKPPTSSADLSANKPIHWDEVDKTSERVRLKEQMDKERQKGSEQVTHDGDSTTYSKSWSW